MRIAYLTTDDVNQNLALHLAAGCRVNLITVWPRDPAPDGQFDALLYDLDYLPLPQRQEILAELAGKRPSCPVAVHSYSLADDLVAALRRNQVTVFRRLDPEVFQFLRRAIRQASETVRPKADQLEHVP